MKEYLIDVNDKRLATSMDMMKSRTSSLLKVKRNKILSSLPLLRKYAQGTNKYMGPYLFNSVIMILTRFMNDRFDTKF